MAKGLVQEENKKVREVQPIGFLHTHGRSYYLLNLKPLIADWENEHERRFTVVPTEHIDMEGYLFSFARHIVTNSYAIEYNPNIAPIMVWDLGDIDINAEDDPYSKGLEEEKSQKYINNEPDWHQLELTDMIRSMEESNG